MTEKELKKLYSEAYKSVYWTAMSILKNEAEAEDVVQDTFITAYETYDTLKDKDKAVAWVKRIAANKCLNIVTRRRTFNADDEFLENVEDISDNFLPDSIVESEEKRKIIMDIINDSLSEDTAMTIILFYFNEMSVKEIAERLGIPQGTVLSRMNYAKKKIKREVEKYEKENKDKLFVMGAPFLTLLFEKEAEQVPFIPMPASLKAVTASSKTAVKATAKEAAKATAKTTAKMTAIKGTAIGITAAVVLGGGGFIAYKALSDKTDSPGVSVESSAAYVTAEATEAPINVLGMTPDLLNLEGGCVRYCTSHLITEDTYEERDQLYYDADGNMVLDCLYNEDGTLVYSDYFIYDDEGRVVREELWDTGTYNRGLYRVYTYGADGLERMEEGQFEEEPEHYHTYEYDSQGRLVIDTEINTEFDRSYWYCEYQYEDDGTYTTHVTSFDIHRQEMVMSEDYCTYSADGVLLEDYTDFQSVSNVYNYDDDGVLVSADMYYGSNLHQTTVYEYDDQGRLVHDYTALTGRDPHRENSYTYDEL